MPIKEKDQKEEDTNPGDFLPGSRKSPGMLDLWDDEFFLGFARKMPPLEA